MIDKLCQQTETCIEVGIAIHVGSVVFGNVGSFGRLDFTIIGKEVNYTSRLEPWCKTLGVPLIMSDKFVKTANLDNARCLGEFTLKGFPGVAPLYTIPLVHPNLLPFCHLLTQMTGRCSLHAIRHSARPQDKHGGREGQTALAPLKPTEIKHKIIFYLKVLPKKSDRANA